MPALQTDLMGVGIPAEPALLLGYSNYTAVTAAGTATGTATQLTASQAACTAASNATGVRLNSASVLNKEYLVTSVAASTADLVVYPPSGGNINGLGTNVGFVLKASQGAIFIRQTTTLWIALPSQSTAGSAPVGGQTASPRTVAIGGLVPAVSTDFNNSTPVITEVYIGEILVPCTMTVTGIAVFNGSDVTGNVRFGLANSVGTVVASTVSTAGSGPDAYQRIAFSAPYVAAGPATYYILGSYSSGTARYNSPILGSFGASVLTGQVYDTFPATITPPTTFTTNVANIASLY